MLKKKEILYDEETGEIFLEKDKSAIPTRIKFKERHRFSKTYHLEMATFENKAYYKYFYLCLCNVEMYTNRVIKAGVSRQDNKALSVNDIAKLCDTTPKTIYSFLNYCAEQKIIRRLDLDGKLFGYFVNPTYVLNGEFIDPILFLMFKGHGIEKYISKGSLSLLNDYVKTCKEEDIIKNSYKNYNS